MTNETTCYVGMTYSQNLMHYGVKGMKWGKRKTEYDAYGRRKAGAASAAVEGLVNLTSPVTQFYIPKNTPSMNLRKYAKLKYHARKYDEDLKLSYFVNKRAAIGLAVSTIDSGIYRTPYQLGKNAVRGGFKQKPELSKKGMSVDEIRRKVVAPINHGYPGIGTTNNCMRTTYAYEMRRRGYDVAATKTEFSTGQTNTTGRYIVKKLSAYQLVKSDKPSTGIVKTLGGYPPKMKDVLRDIDKLPDGARGEVVIKFPYPLGGHSMAFEKIKGKPHIIDAQSGEIYTKNSKEPDMFNLTVRARISRLDDKKLDPVVMATWLKDGS